MGIINFAKPVTGNVFADIMLWLVNLTSVVGGVILFTILLKLVTFPFDYFSRASMRKNSVLMEQMRPELEKLQKQYADNKNLYNQKMMALYKKNGYSMFGACLPTILTLVIFIIAINGFTAYSQFQNRQYFYDMSVSYNNVVYAGLDIDDNYIVRTEEGKIVVANQKIYDIFNGEDIEDTEKYVLTRENDSFFVLSFDKNEDGKIEIIKNTDGDFNIYVEKVNSKIKVWTTNSYVLYETEIKGTEPNIVYDVPQYSVLDNISDSFLKSEENNDLRIKRTENGEIKEYSINEEIALEILYNEKIEESYKEYLKTATNPKTKEDFTNEYKSLNTIEAYRNTEYKTDFLLDIRKEKAAERFRKDKASFLWVSNIWVSDSPMAHPVESDWKTFKATHAYNYEGMDDTEYQKLISKLDVEKTAPNGYFILVVLTAAVSLIMQIVMSKAQKAQMELQTVDGQGAATQKVMKWMMPSMMAIFAFMYTAAFSIYIIISSVISILTTYLINFIVDRKLKKKKQIVVEGEQKVIRGRVYTPKVEEKKKEEKKEKKKKDDKFAHSNGGDFLTGPAKRKKR